MWYSVGMEQLLTHIFGDFVLQSDYLAIKAMETDGGHIHIMIDYPPTKSILEIVNNFKSMATNRIYKKHKVLHSWEQKAPIPLG